MNEARVRYEIDIPASRKKVWDFLVDPHKIPLVLPGLVENVDIPPLPLQNGSSFKYRYLMYGVMLEGHWKVTALETPSRYEAETDGDVSSHWRYDLTEDGGRTHVKLDVTYKTPASLTGKVKGDVLAKINQSEAEAYMKNLKAVLEMQQE
jgi:ligand-binding SRPBCC domain-containing protein